MKRALVLFSLLLAASAHAHSPSDSYLLLTPGATQASFQGAWDIALRDLDHALRLDDGDGALTWGEVVAREQECTRHVLARLQVASAAGSCAVRSAPLQIVQRSDGAHARFALAIDCHGARALQLGHRFLAELDPDHRLLVRVGSAEAPLHVLSAAQGPLRLPAVAGASAAQATGRTTLGAFVTRGIEHIFAGLDHVLFLLVLLLPSVLRKPDPGELSRRRGWWRALKPLVTIVTAFTLAHSLTLSLAALGAVRVSAAVIEPAIAASVALAALNNLYPIFDAERWVLAFALGLLHGFGFASALSDAGLAGRALLPALFGFNLGVELGQLAIVALLVPLARVARQASGYRSFALRGGSLVVLAISLIWLFERIQTG
jgi:HupE / UreJ protein